MAPGARASIPVKSLAALLLAALLLGIAPLGAQSAAEKLIAEGHGKRAREWALHLFTVVTVLRIRPRRQQE